MWSSLEHSPHPATALFSGQEAAWPKLPSFCCAEGAGTVPHGVSPRMQEQRLLSKGTHDPTRPGGVTSLIHLHLYPQNSKPTRKPQRVHRLPCSKPVRCSQHPWVGRALLQGCFYGYKLFMLYACKMVMLNKSLLQPAKGRVVFKVVFSPFRTSSACELSLLMESKQTQDRFKRHQKTTFVQI